MTLARQGPAIHSSRLMSKLIIIFRLFRISQFLGSGW